MKMSRIFRTLWILGILMVLLFSNYRIIPAVAADDNARSANKISGSLALHTELKKRKLITGNQFSEATTMTGDNIDFLGKMDNLQREKAFLYFNEKPSKDQIADLESQGVIVYPDSWIPPVNDHPSGFILVDMPIDKLETLANKNYIVRMDTAELTLKPQNDLAREIMNVSTVWKGGYDGTGVTIAILDSGLDTSNADIPTPVATKDYSNYPELDDTIDNVYSGHGTFVTGEVVGQGTNSAGKYKGVAPGAKLVFLKAKSDSTGTYTTSAVVYAIQAAVNIYNADIINLSIGAWSEFHDGTDAVCQAVDYAVFKGATVFAAAGNDADGGCHYSGTVKAGNSTDFIQVNVKGQSLLGFNLVWYEGEKSSSLSLEYYDSARQKLNEITYDPVSGSSRGTKSLFSIWGTLDKLSIAESGTYYLRVKNSSSSDQYFHLYYIWPEDFPLVFDKPDPAYTLNSPAEDDSAIAIGAYVTRNSWTNYIGDSYNYRGEKGAIAAFSSRGPRVDEAAAEKPELVAPGCLIISARDSVIYPWPNFNVNAEPYPYDIRIIDDNGSNDGKGPADYFIDAGTSAACPLAAGVGALLLNKTSTLTPAQVRHALEVSATNKGEAGFDTVYGWGLINAEAAINVNTNWESFRDNDHTQVSNDFTSDGTQQTVYMYGTGYLASHNYAIVYYNESNKKVVVEYVTSSSDGSLSSQHQWTTSTSTNGTWHVSVCEPEFTPPSKYSDANSYTIITDTFDTRLPSISPTPSSSVSNAAGSSITP